MQHLFRTMPPGRRLHTQSIHDEVSQMLGRGLPGDPSEYGSQEGGEDGSEDDTHLDDPTSGLTAVATEGNIRQHAAYDSSLADLLREEIEEDRARVGNDEDISVDNPMSPRIVDSDAEMVHPQSSSHSALSNHVSSEGVEDRARAETEEDIQSFSSDIDEPMPGPMAATFANEIYQQSLAESFWADPIRAEHQAAAARLRQAENQTMSYVSPYPSPWAGLPWPTTIRGEQEDDQEPNRALFQPYAEQAEQEESRWINRARSQAYVERLATTFSHFEEAVSGPDYQHTDASLPDTLHELSECADENLQGVLSRQATVSSAIHELWKTFDKNASPLLRLSPEIHKMIFGYLNPIDACCVSIASKYFHTLQPVTPKSQGGYGLMTGSPYSNNPILGGDCCKHCVPVLFAPSHCELHFHLRSSMSKETKFCAACELYTHCESNGFWDSHEHCGKCGVNYRKRYERGRRRLNTTRTDENGRTYRVRPWFSRKMIEDTLGDSGPSQPPRPWHLRRRG